MRDDEKTKEQLIAELAELRQSLNALVENLPEGFFVVDAPDLKIRIANREACRMVGTSREEFEGIRGEEHFRFYQVFHPHGDPARPEELPLARAIFAGEVVRNEEWLVQVRDGTRFPILCHAGPIRDRQGTITGGVISWQNVADRKQAEETLRESEKRFRAIFDQAPLGIALMDSCTGRFVEINQSYCEIVGRPREEMLTRTFQSITHPETLQADVENLAQVIEGRARSFVSEKRYLRPDGSTVWASLTVVALWEEGQRARFHLAMVKDITERKRSEEALRKARDELERRVEERTAELRRSQQWLEEAQHIAKIGNWEWDARTNEVLWSDEMYRIFGVSKETFRLSFEEHLKLIPAEDHQDYLAGLERALAGKEVWDREHRLRLPDGGTRYVWASGAVRRDAQGNITGLVGTSQDVTERRRAEESLRASEERFRVAFEEAPAGMVIGVGDGVISQANRAVCRMSGYSQEELVGRHVRDLTHPDDRHLTVPLVPRLLAGEISSFSVEKRFLRKDGQPFWAQSTTAAIRGPDGKLAFALGIVEDITARKRAEEALRQSHEELQAIYDGMMDGLTVVDIDTVQAVRLNPAFCHMLGYSEEEARSLTGPQLHPPEALPAIWEHFRATLQGRTATFEAMPFLRKDGSIAHADVAGKRISYRGRPCLISFYHDVTQRKRAQEALQRKQRTLEHMLRASDHERQVIAYDIHDGLAQQLAGAIMQFQVYEHVRKNRPPEAQKAYDAGVTLLRQSHAEARRLISGVRPPILDEAGVMAAVSHLVNERGADDGPKIEVRSKVRFGRLVPTLENAVYRIVQEGLSNACRHSQSQRVRLSLSQQDGYLRIEIRDWGVGFDPRIARDNRYGLAGMRERARLLGGKFRIRSSPGEGTRVVVEVPIVERTAEE